jgi:hypothetical protein
MARGWSARVRSWIQWSLREGGVVDLPAALGDELMDGTRVREVIAAIRRLPLHPEERSYLFRRWARLVDYRYSAAELAEVVGDGD